MKKIYETPELMVTEVKFTECLAVSQSSLPENPIPDLGGPGDGDFSFDF